MRVPDFLVKLRTGKMLLLETKGWQTEQDRAMRYRADTEGGCGGSRLATRHRAREAGHRCQSGGLLRTEPDKTTGWRENLLRCPGDLQASGRAGLCYAGEYAARREAGYDDGDHGNLGRGSVMVQTAAGMALTDPMHLEGWEEQDEPLATDYHGEEQAYCFMALRYLLNPDGHYVAKDRWLRMDPANGSDKLLPDLLIALDVLRQQWGVDEYLPWEVGKAPEVLAEFLSPSSVMADQRDKPERYGKLGVREYFLFDPDGTYRVPRIQGWALRRDGSRVALPEAADGGVASRVIPVRFLLTEEHIGVVDTRTGALALRYDDAQRTLREEIEARWRAEAAQERAEAARLQTEQAQQQEAAARRAAEAELERLRAVVARLRRGDHDGSGEG